MIKVQPVALTRREVDFAGVNFCVPHVYDSAASSYNKPKRNKDIWVCG